MQSSTRRAYDLNGFTLAIVASEDRYARFLDPILLPLACPIPPTCDWTISLVATAAVEPPVHGRRIFEGPLPEGLTSMMIEDGNERTLIAPGHFAMTFRRTARTTEICFVPGKEGTLSGTAAWWALDDLLAAHKQFLLHGALLVDPATERSIALFAPSGTGKTTTALALARAGLDLGGDDALVLHAGEDRCRIWAVPRKIKVHRRTAELLPWLAPIMTDTWVDDEQPFELGALSSFVRLATPQKRPVERVIILKPPNQTGHAVTAMGKPDALAAIVADNVRIAPDGIDADNAAVLKALANLITATPVIAVSVGPDPGSLSREIIGLH